jgi:hypothetical protein
LQAIQRGKDMFDHVHAGIAERERCLSRLVDPMFHEGRNAGLSRQIAADKDEPTIRRSRTELHLDIVSCPKAEAGESNALGNRVLTPKGPADFLLGKE